MKNVTGIIFPLAIIAAALFLMSFLTGGGAAEKPAAFAEGLTLEQATSRASESGKPVLVFVTADWCAPCQNLKRTTLADARVNEAIRSRTEPVYLDITSAQANPEGAAAAQAMGVRGIPALLLLRDGSVISRQGPMSADVMINWLESN